MHPPPYGWFYNSIDKAENIIKTLKESSKYDIILFQEAFSYKIRNKIYNSAFLIDDNGNVIYRYDKVNLWLNERKEKVNGKRNNVVKTKFIKFNCYLLFLIKKKKNLSPILLSNLLLTILYIQLKNYLNLF